jgi:hypothetical protein
MIISLYLSQRYMLGDRGAVEIEIQSEQFAPDAKPDASDILYVGTTYMASPFLHQ